MAKLGFHWTDFHEIDIWGFRKSLEKIQALLKSDKINWYLHEDQHTRLIISHSFLLTMINISDKRCREQQNTHLVFSNFYFENRAVYERMWKNTVEWGRPQMTIWRMRIACCIPKATNTHTGCVILIAFPLQQWLHERASTLRHTCTTWPAAQEFCSIFFHTHGPALLRVMLYHGGTRPKELP